MRRPLLLLAVLAVPACEPGVSGTYELVSIDGRELPDSFEFWGDTLDRWAEELVVPSPGGS